MADDREVVRDDHVREPELVLEVVQQVDHLRLDRHVQRRDRFVGDDQLRAQGERAGDADALTLSAGELVRVAVVVLGAEPDQRQQLLDVVLETALGLDALEPERRADDRADRVPRVQRGVRVLEDHLDVAAHRPHLAHGQVRDVPALELDLAARRLDQPGDEPAHRRLAAAGLADDAQGLPRVHLEVDAVDGLDRGGLPSQQALADREVLDQALDPEQRLARGGGLLRNLHVLLQHRRILLLAHVAHLTRLAHSFGAISSVQIRVRSSGAMWQAEK